MQCASSYLSIPDETLVKKLPLLVICLPSQRRLKVLNEDKITRIFQSTCRLRGGPKISNAAKETQRPVTPLSFLPFSATLRIARMVAMNLEYSLPPNNSIL